MNKNIFYILFSLIFIFNFLFLPASGVRATGTDFSQTITNPTAAPTSITINTTTASTTASTVCSASKPGSAPTLFAAVPGNNSVTLTWSKASDPVTRYLIAYGTTADVVQFGNPNAGGPDTTSTTINGLSGGTTYYFRVKAINDCMPGGFSGVLAMAPAGAVINTTGPTENFVPASEIQRLLFDIALTIESAVLNKSSNLIARTQFTSFGTVPTLVNLVYRIEDAGGKEVYTEKGEITVETEKTVTKEFKSLVLGSGKYTLILTTTYGNNVTDEFKQAFEVQGATSNTWTLILVVVSVISGVIAYLCIKRRKIKKPL